MGEVNRNLPNIADNQRCPGDGGVASYGAPFRAKMGTLRDVWRVHCGVCEIGLRLLLFDRSVQIIVWYLWYWYLYHDVIPVTVFCLGKAKWFISSMMCWMKLLKMYFQKMYMLWNSFADENMYAKHLQICCLFQHYSMRTKRRSMHENYTL